MSLRNFNNVTTIGTLVAPVAASATSLSVQNFSNYPTVPFTATLDRNLATEEIVLVTAAFTGALTVVRGYDGTAAQAHSAGAAIEHTAGAIEYTEANQHVNATVNVHGTTGDLLGAEGNQTIFDKTLVSPLLQADVSAGDAVVAYVPSTAASKNLFRGVSPTGTDVITVDSSGNLNAASLGSTGATNVHGNLAVTGTSTLTGAAALNGGATVPTGKKLTLTDSPVANTDGANKSYVDSAVSPKAPLASPTFTGKVSTPTLDLTGTGDASATTDGPLVIGPRTGVNLTIDNNEIVARNAGAVAGFSLLGNLSVTVPTPTSPAHASTKGYCDTRLVAYSGQSGASAAISGSTFTRVTGTANGQVSLVAGRVYRVKWVLQIVNSAAGNNAAALQVTMTDAAATPQSTDPVIAQGNINCPSWANGGQCGSADGLFQVATTKVYSYSPWFRMAALSGKAGTIQVTAVNDLFYITIEDMGPISAFTATNTVNPATPVMITA